MAPGQPAPLLRNASFSVLIPVGSEAGLVSSSVTVHTLFYSIIIVGGVVTARENARERVWKSDSHLPQGSGVSFLFPSLCGFCPQVSALVQVTCWATSLQVSLSGIEPGACPLALWRVISRGPPVPVSADLGLQTYTFSRSAGNLNSVPQFLSSSPSGKHFTQ